MASTRGVVRALVVLALVGLGLTSAVISAAPARAQGFTTPTPGPDGKIIYIVRAGDDLWTIAALSGRTVEELMALNGIQPGDFITPGMELLLGLAGPALPTTPPEVPATATLIPPSPTPVFGTGEICVMLFLDANGDARVSEGEVALAGGQISVAEPSGALAGEHTTAGEPEGFCFVGLQNGDYNVSAAAPQDHNPTTAMNVPVQLEPGEIKHIEFGAQPSAALGGGGSAAGGPSTLLGLLGLGLLAGAVALGVTAARLNRGRPRRFR